MEWERYQVPVAKVEQGQEAGMLGHVLGIRSKIKRTFGRRTYHSIPVNDEILIGRTWNWTACHCSVDGDLRIAGFSQLTGCSVFGKRALVLPWKYFKELIHHSSSSETRKFRSLFFTYPFQVPLAGNDMEYFPPAPSWRDRTFSILKG